MALANTDRVGAVFSRVLIATCLLAIAPGCQQQKAPLERKKPAVGVTPVTVLDAPLIVSSNSTTRAANAVTISARVKGFLKEILFTEGSEVKKGELLFVIDEQPYKVALAQAKAMLAEAKSGLEKAKTSKGREIAAAQLALAVAGQVLQTVEDQRARLLYSRNAASKGDLDLAEAQLQKANAQVDVEKASLEQAKTDFDVNIQAAQAKVDQAQANLDDAQINLSYCRMFAPLDGRIGEALIKLDNLVGNGGETPLATIQQLDPMGVDLQVSSTHLPKATELVKNQQEIEVDLGEERPQRFKGKLSFIDNTVSRTTSTFLVKANVPNAANTILPGEYARAFITIDTRKNALVVPERAIVEGQAGTTVYVVSDGKVNVVPVVLDTDTYKGSRVVTSGLTAGQKVIVEGIQLVRPGAEVESRDVEFKLIDDTPSGLSRSASPSKADTVTKPVPTEPAKAEAKPAAPPAR